MQRIAKFHKVSYKQFKEGFGGIFKPSWLGTRDVEPLYKSIKLPQRATSGSAGYDFYAPFDIMLFPGETIKVPTGIRVAMDEGWVLKIYPRSGFGFKYRLQLDNTVGIIDSDYFYSDNEGHIFIKITNDSRDDIALSIPAGIAFAQGIFLEYGITVDDEVTATRNGGFGSTGMK